MSIPSPSSIAPPDPQRSAPGFHRRLHSLIRSPVNARLAPLVVSANMAGVAPLRLSSELRSFLPLRLPTSDALHGHQLKRQCACLICGYKCKNQVNLWISPVLVHKSEFLATHGVFLCCWQQFSPSAGGLRSPLRTGPHGHSTARNAATAAPVYSVRRENVVRSRGSRWPGPRRGAGAERCRPAQHWIGTGGRMETIQRLGTLFCVILVSS